MPELIMPNVGEGVTEGTVTKWLKREGDGVALDEAIVEIETDKAVAEIPSPFAGRLAKILVAEGDTVPIGTPLAEFELTAGAPGAHERVEGAPVATVAAPVAMSAAMTKSATEAVEARR
ncbi:MAG: biotin/lipoyl-containing protein, partial [Chloroflexota bacterium]